MKTLESSCPYCLGSGTYGAAMPQVDGEAISDAAVEAGKVSLLAYLASRDDAPEDFDEAVRQLSRKVIAAALPHLSPRPPQGAAVEPFRWLVNDEAFASESLAIEAIRQWGPSGSIAIPLYATPQPAALNEHSGNSGRLAGVVDGEVGMKELARDIHYAITDDGLAPLGPAENNAMREAILRVLAALNEPSGNSDRLAGVVVPDWRGLPVHPHVRARTLLTLLWRNLDNGGRSMGRSFEAVLLEAAMRLTEDHWDADDVKRADGAPESDFINDTRDYVAALRRHEEGLATQPAPSAGEQA